MDVVSRRNTAVVSSSTSSALSPIVRATRERPTCQPLTGYTAVLPAAVNEFKPLEVGSLKLWPPLVAAPMAGITNAATRRLYACHGAQMATSEMIIARTLVHRNKETQNLARFHAHEAVRSAQLYGVRPADVEQASRILAEENGVSHIDINFGCPVRKITAKGGGSALALRPKLFARLIAAAVKGAGPGVPVTVKMRVGFTQNLKTYLQAGKIAEAEGAAAITLHARTADQLYSPPAHWEAIGELVHAVQVPVIGNGDIFEAADAIDMMRQTGCAGVMVGRAALGRPWVFREIQDVFGGSLPRAPPVLGEVVSIAYQHLVDWVQWEGEAEERMTVQKMRKLIPLYLYGFKTAGGLQIRLLNAKTCRDWQTAMLGEAFDLLEPFPASGFRHARLKGGAAGQLQKMSLPPNWLVEKDGDDVPACLDDAACEG